MSQALALYHLQQIELAIARGEKRLGEIAGALTDDAEVGAARTVAGAAARAVSPLRAKVRDLELEIQTTTQKAAATEQQLYSGSVKNPKAMQEMQQEIEALKARGAQLDERLLEAMMALEEAESAQTEAEAALTATTQGWQAQHGDLLAEQTDLEAKLAALNVERDDALKAVTPASLKGYNTLKPRRGGQPVALLNGLSCTMCGVEQTTAVVQDVRRGDKLIQCSNCGRILADKG
jgi:predicted  nucleic acid-binding Zn-ribbon protein